MLKFLGQHIVDLIARFRSDVYLENVESGTIANGGNLGLDSNNKIVKAEAGPTYSDNQALGIGTGNDFTATHNGTDTYLGNNTGDLYITQQADDKDIIFRSDDGSGGVETYFFLDGSYGANPYTIFPDNSTLALGSNRDLLLVHDATDSKIDNYVGDLKIRNFADDKDIIFQSDDGSGGATAYLTLDGGLGYTTVQKRIQLQDSVGLYLGTTTGDFIYHNGSNTFWTHQVGDLTIETNQDDGDIIFKSDDGSGGTTEYFRVDGGSEKTIYTKPISLLDSVGLQLGTGTDAQIYHTGSEGTFINYTGNFRFIQSADNADLSFYSDDGSGGTTAYLTLDGSEEQNLFTKRVRIDHDVSDASVASVGLDIDMDVSGSNALSSDITQRAIHANLASTATGGDTSDEHRLIAIQGHSRTSGAGDADDIRGVYGLAQSNRSSSATTSLLRGVHGIAYANDSASAVSTDIRGGDFSCYVDTDGPDITTMYGVLGSAYTNTNSTDNVSNVYGAFGKAESRGSGTISNAYGVLGEIEVDAGTITTGQCFRAVVDHNGGTLTTGYMYRGTTSGTVGTQWGIHLDGEDKNYFSGNVGIGITSTTSLFHVNAADGVMVDTYMARIQNSEATAGDNFGLYVQAGSNSSDVSFRVTDKDANDYFRVRGDGNVGIGTTSPAAKLHVDGDLTISGTAPTLRIQDSRNLNNPDWDNVSLGNIEFYSSDTTSPGARVLSEIEAFSSAAAASGPNSELRFKTSAITDSSPQTRLTISYDGNVGIGTTGPTELFEVYKNGGDVAIKVHEDAGTHEAKIHLRRGGSDWELINNNDLAIESEGTELFRIKTSGNVGIGTASPDSLLELSSSSVTDFLKLTSGGSSANPIKLIFEKSGSEQGIIEYNRNGDLEIYNTDGDGGVMIDGSASGGGDLYVNNAGNVGIGMTSPSAKLEVSAGGTTSQEIAHFGNSNDVGKIKMQLNSAGAGKQQILDGDNNVDIVLDAQGDSYFNISHGNVGIGTTSPGNKLEVHSGTTNVAGVFKSSDNQAWISVQDDDSGTYGALFGTDSDAGHHIVLADRSANKRLVVDSSGNVGIGTDSPGAPLEVNGNITTTGGLVITHPSSSIMQIYNTSTSSGIDIRTGSGSIVQHTNSTGGFRFKTDLSSTAPTLSNRSDENTGVGWSGSDDLYLITGGTNAITINSSQNVGVGTTSPGEKLEVSGNIKASGTLVGKTRNVYNANFVADLGTTEYFVPLSTNVESTQAHQEEAAMLMPYDGRLVNVMFRTNSDIAHSDATLTVKLYKCAANVNAQGGGNFAAVGTAATHTIQAGDDHHVFNFACNADNTFSHTDLVAVSVQSNVDMHNSAKFVYCTVIFEYDLNTELTTTTEYDSTP